MLAFHVVIITLVKIFIWQSHCITLPIGFIYIVVSSNGCHYGPIFFKPEKNLEFFRLKNWPIDGYPGRLE